MCGGLRKLRRRQSTHLLVQYVEQAVQDYRYVWSHSSCWGVASEALRDIITRFLNEVRFD